MYISFFQVISLLNFSLNMAKNVAYYSNTQHFNHNPLTKLRQDVLNLNRNTKLRVFCARGS